MALSCRIILFGAADLKIKFSDMNRMRTHKIFCYNNFSKWIELDKNKINKQRTPIILYIIYTIIILYFNRH